MTDAANPILTEVKNQVPRVAELLDVRIQDLHLTEYFAIPNRYMGTTWRDRPIKTLGLSKDMPFLKRGRLHGKSIPGVGLILYECRDRPDLKYVLLSTYDPTYGFPVKYFFCKKGELASIYRNCVRLEKNCTIRKKPVLKEGLLEEIISSSVDFLLNSKKIEQFGVRIKRGILLDGPPGNGKTMACRYIQKLCAENNIDWGVVTASEIDKAYNDNALDNLFSTYTVTFYDDIDISYFSRKHGNNGKMACAILTAMDGMTESGHTVRFFTTNEEVKSLDPAFLRPGRIDRRMSFEKPDATLRKKLVEVWPEEISSAIDVDHLVRETDKHSFAEIEAVRANLVTNFLFGDKTWNLEKALMECQEDHSSFDLKSTSRKLGFGKEEGAKSGVAAAKLPNPTPR